MYRDKINPFPTAIAHVLSMFGITDVKQNELLEKDAFVTNTDVAIQIGLVGGMKGNVSYCFSGDTAKQLASTMMMGMPVEEIDDMVKSALSELGNMFAGTAATLLTQEDVVMDITPPSVSIGEELKLVVAFLYIGSVSVETPAGNIEVNIGIVA